MGNGGKRAGYKDVSTGRMAFNTVPRDGRPATIQDGFNFQGDRQRAHWSTLTAELPKAEATGKLDLRPSSHAFRIAHNGNGKVTAVHYFDADGNEHVQKARAVCVAGNAIESARLLLLSDSPQHPDGLANSSGQVGRNYMRHLTGSVYGEFEQPVRMYRGETMAGIITDEARNDPDRGFIGGYYMQLLALGLPFYAAFLDPGGWGPDFAARMEAYERVAGMWLVGEDMPQESNRVTLNRDVTDQHGLPVPNVHFDDHPNDVAMREHAYQAGESVYNAVDAMRVNRVTPYPSTHNLGTCRMSADPADGVVNEFGRAHDVPNLFVSDGLGLHHRRRGEPDPDHRGAGHPPGRAHGRRDEGGQPVTLSLVHTCVRVRDIDAAVRFYELLGFERRGKLDFGVAFNIYMGLPGDGDKLELTVNVGREEPYDLGDGYNHIALTVEDLDGLLAKLAEEGIEPEKPPFAPGGREEVGRICFVGDPDGYRVELIDGGSFPTPQDP